MSADETKISLSEQEIPTSWYNIQADMPNLPEPPISPATLKPATPQELGAIFPMELLKQEMSAERYIEIPEEVRRIYQLWRPTPLYRARRLEKALDTPAHIYYKYEGTSPAGSHKLNTALAQVYYNKEAGIKRLTTETGAGQWGSALAQACSFFGLECKVYMVKVSYNQKPYRRSFMQVFGAQVIPSPSDQTASGRKILEQDPDSQGSLGMAISEAVEEAAGREDTNYSLGSVLNHVLLHQTVIGQEAQLQMEKTGEYPDTIIACHGGGSNFGGLTFPFLKAVLNGSKKTKVIAAEPAACPTLSRGAFAFDYGDTAGLTPIMRMYTLGHDFMPPGIHAGGLRYHGASPLVSQLVHDGFIEPRIVEQNPMFEAALLFARSEGILPAPESAHAIRAALDEALAAKEAGEKKVILFGLSGHGHFDLTAYDEYLGGNLIDVHYSQELLQESLAQLPQI